MNTTTIINKKEIKDFFKENFKLDFIKEYELESFNDNNKSIDYRLLGHVVEYMTMLANGLHYSDLYPVKNFNLHYKGQGHISGQDIIYRYNLKRLNFKSNIQECLNELIILGMLESKARSSLPIELDDLVKIESEVKNKNEEKQIAKNIFNSSIKKTTFWKHKIVYNPHFKNSHIANDADFIIVKEDEKVLYEIKTSKNGKIDISYIYQLLVYLFLAKSNGIVIDKIGLYMSRQNFVKEWSINEIMKNSKFINLAEAASNFYDILKRIE